MPSLPPGGITPASAFSTAARARQQKPAAILAPAVDPVTGDFESVFRGRGLADAFAIEALRVQRGSGASVRELGQRFAEVTHLEDGGAEVLESMTAEAWADAETAGVSRLASVTISPDDADPTQVHIVTEYRDLLAPAGTPLRRLVFSR